MTEKVLNLQKFEKTASKLNKEQVQNIKGGYNRIPGAEESTGIVNWDNIDIRSNGDFTADRGNISFLGRRRNN